MENSEKSKNSGNKNKTDSWVIEFLKSDKFNKESLEISLKEDILDLCKQLGIETLSDFWDLIFRADRNRCCHTFWGEDGKCLDDMGEDVAYGLDAIREAFQVNLCKDVCKVGCCAKQNKLAYNVLCELCEMLDEKEENNGKVD